jgi:hypothetical protein
MTLVAIETVEGTLLGLRLVDGGGKGQFAEEISACVFRVDYHAVRVRGQMRGLVWVVLGDGMRVVATGGRRLHQVVRAYLVLLIVFLLRLLVG